MCHARLKIHNDHPQDVPLLSKQDYEIHTGFRRQKTNVLFSRIYKRCDKFKQVRGAEEPETWYLASFYSQIYFGPTRCVLVSLKNNVSAISMTGGLLVPDPLKVILKRIILTGYPVKVSNLSSTLKILHPFIS